MPLPLNDQQRQALSTLRKQHPQIGRWLAKLSCEVAGERLEDAPLVTEVLLMETAAFDEYSAPAADALIADLLRLDRIGALDHVRAQRFTQDLEALLKE
ncbi:hypothetical protein PS627_01629 [Pseudomonas fluorescens]|uniref:hypothetical protein n=1 Tax=Pseudomonas fluorescens TaxID=294 RepID=UPI001256112A|nr:hypothetical protein [Pseudomonas fluorescens]CAG8865710.1 hypothetical protein PS627_01629 [Pseudomonas fluorescens]